MDLIISETIVPSGKSHGKETNVILISDEVDKSLEANHVTFSSFVKPSTDSFSQSYEILKNIFSENTASFDKKSKAIADLKKVFLPSCIIYAIPEYFTINQAVVEILNKYNPDTLTFVGSGSISIARFRNIDRKALIKAAFYIQARRRNLVIKNKKALRIKPVYFRFYLLGLAKLIKDILEKITFVKPDYLKINQIRQKKIIFFNHAYPHSLVIRPILDELTNENQLASIVFDQDGYLSGADCSLLFEQNVKVYLSRIFKVIYDVYVLTKFSLNLVKGNLDLAGEQFVIRIMLSLYLINNISAYCFYKAYLEGIVNIIKPDIIVNSEDRGILHRTIFLTANNYNVPSVLLQCGLYLDHPLYKPEILATKFCVEGMAVKRILVERLKHPEEKIIVTGQPKYEWIKNSSVNYDITKTVKTLKIKDISKPMVFVATSNMEENPYSLVNTKIIQQELSHLYKGIISLLDDYSVIIKPHPMEDKLTHKKLINYYGLSNRIFFVEDSQITAYELLLSSKYVITRFSTIGIEALAAGNILFIYGDEKVNIDNIYLTYGVGFKLSNEKSFREQFDKASLEMKSETYRAKIDLFLMEYANALDGKAVSNITSVFDSLCNFSKIS